MSPRHINCLLTLSFMLGFIGLSIYVVEPLRPVHIGFLCIVGLVLLVPDIRKFLTTTAYLPALVVLVVVLAAQLFWIENWERYIRHVVFIVFGFSFFFLGGLVTQRRLDVKTALIACVAVWLVSAVFPFFDAWADAERFRKYLFTGGVWRNPNNLGTVLVFATLLEFIVRKKISWPLFFLGWFYVIALSRRADTVAFLVLGSTYLVFFTSSTIRRRIQVLILWALVSIAGIQVIDNHAYWRGFLAHFSVAAQHNPDTSKTTVRDGSSPFRERILASEKPNIEPGAATAKEAKEVAKRTRDLSRELKQYDFLPIQRYADATRFILAAQMLEEAKNMPWWQWLFGRGAGQLNLIWSVDKTPYASAHFFWLEMFFYIGIAWFMLLLALFYKLGWHGRVALVVMGIAGMAPSSLLTITPFWYLFGILFYMAFIKVNTHGGQSCKSCKNKL